VDDSLSVAAVTLALADLLAAAADAVPGTQVATLSPGSEPFDGGAPRIALWLLAAAPDPAVRREAPVRVEPGGYPRPRPGLPLTLSYLIGFYGDEARLEPQRLLGAAAAALHSNPMLDPVRIARALDRVPWGARSGRAMAHDAVAIRLLPADLESLGRAWPGLPGARRGPCLLCSAGPVTVGAPEPLLRGAG
jgi:hypothetical protein